MHKPTIIEFTWFPWSWKTTVLRHIKKQNILQNKNIEYCFDFKEKYMSKYEFLSALFVFFYAIYNAKYFFYLRWILKHMDLLSKFYIFYQIYQYNFIRKNNKSIIFDQYLLQIIPSKKILESELDHMRWQISKFDIYPIHFVTSIEKVVERTAQRKKKGFEFDHLSKQKKLKILKPLKNKPKYKIQKYCELTNKPYLEVDGNASIEVKVKQAKKHIDSILAITNNKSK